MAKKNTEEEKVKKPKLSQLIGRKIEDIGTLNEDLVIFFSGGYAIVVSGDILISVKEDMKPLKTANIK